MDRNINIISGGPYTATLLGLLNDGPLMAVNAGLASAHRLCAHVPIWCCLDLPEQCEDALRIAHDMGVHEIWTSPRAACMMGVPDEVGAYGYSPRKCMVRVIEPSGGSLIACLRQALARFFPARVNIAGLDWPPMDRFRVERQALLDLAAHHAGTVFLRHAPNRDPERIA